MKALSREDAIDATAVSLTRRDGPDAVRTASNSRKRPPTTSSDGHESRRRREGAAAPRDAGINAHQRALALLRDGLPREHDAAQEEDRDEGRQVGEGVGLVRLDEVRAAFENAGMVRVVLYKGVPPPCCRRE